VIARRNRLITPATTPIVSTWKITTSATGGVEQEKMHKHNYPFQNLAYTAST